MKHKVACLELLCCDPPTGAVLGHWETRHFWKFTRSAPILCTDCLVTAKNDIHLQHPPWKLILGAHLLKHRLPFFYFFLFPHCLYSSSLSHFLSPTVPPPASQVPYTLLCPSFFLLSLFFSATPSPLLLFLILSPILFSLHLMISFPAHFSFYPSFSLYAFLFYSSRLTFSFLFIQQSEPSGPIFYSV